MKTKQIVGIVVAGITFIVICLASMLSKNLLTSDIFGTSTSELETSISTPTNDYVGLLKVEGSMTTAETSSGLLEAAGYDHAKLIETVETYMEDKLNKAILLYVNSPGGTVNAADELYQKLMEYKTKTKRPIYVYMGDEACSGGYYVSVAGDKIYANRNTWTGSIGVYVQLSNYKELCDKLGIKTTYITTGKNKTMGSPTEELTVEQQKIFQSIINESYEQFIDVIAAGRKNLTEDKIRVLADGRIYTATQAKNAGLIDEIMSYEDMKKTICEGLGKDVEVYEGEEDSLTDIFEDLFSSVKSLVAKKEEKSETERLLELIENDGSGVPMYYAMP